MRVAKNVASEQSNLYIVNLLLKIYMLPGRTSWRMTIIGAIHHFVVWAFSRVSRLRSKKWLQWNTPINVRYRTKTGINIKGDRPPWCILTTIQQTLKCLMVTIVFWAYLREGGTHQILHHCLYESNSTCAVSPYRVSNNSLSIHICWFGRILCEFQDTSSPQPLVNTWNSQ